MKAEVNGMMQAASGLAEINGSVSCPKANEQERRDAPPFPSGRSQDEGVVSEIAMHDAHQIPVDTPEEPTQSFRDPDAAVDRLIAIYEIQLFLCSKLSDVLASGSSERRFRAFYPEIGCPRPASPQPTIG